jgi:hypothetical protein
MPSLVFPEAVGPATTMMELSGMAEPPIKGGKYRMTMFYLGIGVRQLLSVIASQCSHWRGNPPAGGTLILRKLMGTDCHTSDIGHWFAMTNRTFQHVSLCFQNTQVCERK